MLRNTKIIRIMTINTDEVQMSSYKLVRLVKPSLHYLKNHLYLFIIILSHDILAYFIGFDQL